ncbi:MAG: Nif11-like leader peptide family RiPP precursor [Candidatus Nanopelagicales bacterium]|nr:Nif11-like leader peptide family RiPP precursor [Candidatus Nanopelagicales bacterium]MDZ4250864.1 Nif11-like leader peptide family RiPP precursor [Candidatus Nanopelagicales bacterium]
MSQEQIAVLVTRLKEDEAFAAALAVATDVADAQRIASEAGIEVSADEFLTLIPQASEDVSDAELEAASGGRTGPDTCLPGSILCTIPVVCSYQYHP